MSNERQCASLVACFPAGSSDSFVAALLTLLIPSLSLCFVGARHRAQRCSRLPTGSVCDGADALPARTVGDCALSAAAKA